MEGTAFSIDEASFDASLLPEGNRTPGKEEFHRAVTDTFQRSYPGMGGQLSVVFAAGRIEVAWEPAAAEAPAMATIGPMRRWRWALAALRQEDRAEARQPAGDHHLQPGPGVAGAGSRRAPRRGPTGCCCG